MRNALSWLLLIALVAIIASGVALVVHGAPNYAVPATEHPLSPEDALRRQNAEDMQTLRDAACDMGYPEACR